MDEKSNAESAASSNLPPGKCHSRHHRTAMHRSKRIGMLGLATGIVFGFLLCFWSQPLPCITQSECCLRLQLREEIRHEMSLASEPEKPSRPERKQVLIGVMTAANLIDTRAMAVWNTWAKSINGDVVFFTSEATKHRLELPIIALPGVDDTYPPQKKSFMLVKYLHDFGKDLLSLRIGLVAQSVKYHCKVLLHKNHSRPLFYNKVPLNEKFDFTCIGLDKYDYFMRVDDDVYLHGERLSQFLSKLNHSEPLFIGQAGIGNTKELGQLSLAPDENFCMGGPGMIFSGETLRRTVPHISYCLQHLLTTHEDVEVGRCVRMFAGVPCTWNYQAQRLFYHSYNYLTDKSAFPHDFNKAPLDDAITFHPLKTPELMYQFHHEMLIRGKARLETRRQRLENELADMTYHTESHSITEMELSPPTQRNDILSWTFINKKQQFKHSSFSVKRNIFIQWKQVLNEALGFCRRLLNQQYASKGVALDYNLIDIKSGYYRLHPIHGVQLILILQLNFRRFIPQASNQLMTQALTLNMPLADVELNELPADQTEGIHIILSLSGRHTIFLRFLTTFEKVCGASDNHCDMTVVLFQSADTELTRQSIAKSKYRDKIHVVQGAGNFSRANGLHRGVMEQPSKSLMLFIDVDIHFSTDTLLRIRQHTLRNKQAYFPIVFSQYDSTMACGKPMCPVNDYSLDAGSFRFFGFGIVSIYKEDYTQSGGFDLSIQGWGKEDVDLYTRVIKAGFYVFRSADPSIVHIYHPVLCDENLSPPQLTMCINSKSASYASKQSLAEIFTMHKPNASPRDT